MKFKVTVTEVFEKEIVVDGSVLKEETESEASQYVFDCWHESKICLTDDDFKYVDMKAEEVKE